MQQLCRPTLGFCNVQIGLTGFLCRIRQLVTRVGNVRPVETDRGFQMLPALVQKVNVRGELDIRRGYRGVHDQLPVVLLSALFLLLGGVRVLPTFQRLLPTGGFVGIVVIVFVIFRFRGYDLLRLPVVAVYVSSILRPFAGADILVDLCNLFHWKTLAKVHHHGGVKQRLLGKLMQPKEVLHVGVLLDSRHTAFVGQLLGLFDENRAEGDPGRIRPATVFHAHGAQIDLFDLLPRHDPGKLHPTVLRVQ